jgi:FkbM family methyltransferase
LVIKGYEDKTKAVLNLSPLSLGRYLINVNSKDRGLSFVLNKIGFREPLNSFFLSRLIRENKPYVVDVGGNVGYFPLIELLSGAEFVEVYEPVTETYNILSKNLQRFPNVMLHNLAIDVEKGVGTIQVFDHYNQASMLQDFSVQIETGVKPSYEQTVHTRTLKQVAVSKENVLLRMDIEGYEEKVLTHIPDNINFLSFELHTLMLGAERAYALIEHLQDQGFRISLMLRELDTIYGLTLLICYLKYFPAFIYNLIDRRIYKNPSNKLMLEIFQTSRECPHIYAVRGK